MPSWDIPRVVIHREAKVIEGNPQSCVSLRDGTTARAIGEELEVRDARGRLLFRYVDGVAELAVERGDLHLRAPNGHIRLEAGMDVTFVAHRDVDIDVGRRAAISVEGERRVEVTGRRTTLGGAEVSVEAQRTRIASAAIEQTARRMTTTATELVQRVERYELAADRIIERSRDVMRDVSELLQHRAGRIRNLVRGAFTLTSDTTRLKSERETAIDGDKVLLG